MPYTTKIFFFYLQQGIVLKKVHRTSQFKQCDFFKRYIDFNTVKEEKRLKVTKIIFKLTSSNYWKYSIYGKTIENICKCTDIQLV